MTTLETKRHQTQYQTQPLADGLMDTLNFLLAPQNSGLTIVCYGKLCTLAYDGFQGSILNVSAISTPFGHLLNYQSLMSFHQMLLTNVVMSLNNPTNQ